MTALAPLRQRDAHEVAEAGSSDQRRARAEHGRGEPSMQTLRFNFFLERGARVRDRAVSLLGGTHGRLFSFLRRRAVIVFLKLPPRDQVIKEPCESDRAAGSEIGRAHV